MNYKYLGEAVALLGIAYSLFRWIIRNAPESDRPGPGRIRIDRASAGWLRAGGEDERASRTEDRSAAGAGGEIAADQTASEGRVARRRPVPTPAPDPGMLDAAAAMFGITTDALISMPPRGRALLLDGYRAARDAKDRGPRRARDGA